MLSHRLLFDRSIDRSRSIERERKRERERERERDRERVMMFHATFNNTSAISCRKFYWRGNRIVL